MRRNRFSALALLALVLALIAAGCGGGDEGGGDTSASGEGGVSGSVTILSLWTGAEGESFKAVLDKFREDNPDATVKYKSASDPASVLSTAVEGGNPPDVAVLSSPGLIKDFADRGALKPIDFAKDVVAENYSQDYIDLMTFDGKLYGVFFKGSNKSTIWYNATAFEDAGIEPPETWDDFLANAETLKASGVPAYSLGAADGWTLTDLFENIYLRTAGGDKYKQLAAHEIPWTDQSVKDAFAEMAKIFKDTDNIAGGVDGALQTDFPTSVSQVFADPPKAAQVIEADFVATVITGETNAELGTDANYFPFPNVGDSADSVLGAGDAVILFKDSPLAEALVKYLATPEAAEIWAARGGFSSPNKSVSEDVYQDDITRAQATALAKAGTFAFDLSDLQPSEFTDQTLYKELQDFVRNPDDIDGTTAALEKGAKKAYGG